MKIITHIKPVDRKGQKFALYLNDGSSYELNPEVIVKFKLQTGQSLDDKVLQQVKEDNEFIQARNVITRYLALRVKATREVGHYLQKKGFSSNTITAIIDYLKVKGELDDYDYATRFVRQRKKLRPCGPLRLVKELSAKGIDENLIDKVLNDQGLFDRDYQRALALKIARKKIARHKRALPRDKQKLYKFLQHHGFESDIIRDTINEVFRASQ